MTALLTGLSTTLLAVILAHKKHIATFLVTILLIVTIEGLGGGYAAGGYVDVLCATLTAAALVAFLCIESRTHSIVIGSVALAAGSLIKGEGLILGLVGLLVVVAVLPSLKLRVLFWGLVAFLPAVFWQILIFRINPSVSVDVSLSNYFHPFSAHAAHRFPLAERGVFGAIWPIGTTSILIVVAVWFLQAHRHGASQGWKSIRPAIGLLLAGALIIVTITLTYSVGYYPIQPWLDQSLIRVVALPQILALSAVVLAVSIAFDALDFTSSYNLENSLTVGQTGQSRSVGP